MPSITEHSVTIDIELPQKDVHKQMPIFYNPVMVSHRNISILLLNALQQSNLKIADPLAGSGIRTLRFLKELQKGKISEIAVNDLKDNFPTYFQQQLKQNKIKKTKNILVENKDANLFLLSQKGFDYLDIDPFGSPNPFLAAAIARVSRQGLLAVTATDTAALTGTYPAVTKRKYWATTFKNPLMHELGLRILIRKIQLLGVQFDRALTPILAYHKDHYFRIYFRVEKGKELCDKLLPQHQYFLMNTSTLEFSASSCNSVPGYNKFCGPLWTGLLQDKKLLQRMNKINNFSEEKKFMQLLLQEKDLLGFHDVYALAGIHKLELPKFDPLLTKLKATRTHFSPHGIKTDKPVQEILQCLKS